MDHDFEDNNRQPVYTDPNADVVIDEASTESQGPAQNPGSAQSQSSMGSRAAETADTKTQDADTEQSYHYQNTDTQQSYSYQTGYQDTGNPQSYSYQTGHQDTGNPQGYSYQTGHQDTGNAQSYSYQTQDNPQQGQGGFNPQYHYSQGYDQHTEMNQGMDTSPMSVTDWLLTILVSVIPCAGIILYFIWAFSQTGNVNRRNFCRAQLIVMGILFILNIILVVVLAVFVFGYKGRMGAGMYYY